jgi:hypothetical protein
MLGMSPQNQSASNATLPSPSNHRSLACPRTEREVLLPEMVHFRVAILR